MNQTFRKAGLRAGWVSIGTNLFLFALKYWAGIITGSIAIIADAWHTLSDSFSSIIVLLSIKISSRPPDKNHPFGHGRADVIASFIIGILLAVIAVNFLIESVQKLIAHGSVEYGRIALIVIIISILMKEMLAQYSFWAGKKSGSKALRADAWHHRSDAISSILILIGIFINKYFWWVDGVLGILVTILLFYATYEILRDAINSIMGEKPDEGLINSINDICQRVSKQQIYPHHVHIHRYGNHTELTLHIKLPGDQNLKEAHDLVSRIEAAIKQELAIEATIHMEPISGDSDG